MTKQGKYQELDIYCKKVSDHIRKEFSSSIMVTITGDGAITSGISEDIIEQKKLLLNEVDDLLRECLNILCKSTGLCTEQLKEEDMDTSLKKRIFNYLYSKNNRDLSNFNSYKYKMLNTETVTYLRNLCTKFLSTDYVTDKIQISKAIYLRDLCDRFLNTKDESDICEKDIINYLFVTVDKYGIPILI